MSVEISLGDYECGAGCVCTLNVLSDNVVTGNGHHSGCPSMLFVMN